MFPSMAETLETLLHSLFVVCNACVDQAKNEQANHRAWLKMLVQVDCIGPGSC